SATVSSTPTRCTLRGWARARSGDRPSNPNTSRRLIRPSKIHSFVAKPFPKSIDETQALLASGEYVADRSLATSLFLSLAMKRPLFLEGEAGVGKTEIGKVVAQALGRDLIRLQGYEGLDTAQAAYEWNYSRQMIEIRLAEAAGEKSKDRLAAYIYSEKFLIKRPL